MGAFTFQNPRDLSSRKKQLAQKLMSRSGRSGGMGRPFGMHAPGGRANVLRGNSMNPGAIQGMGAAHGRDYGFEPWLGGGGAGGSGGRDYGFGASANAGLYGTPGAAQQSAVANPSAADGTPPGVPPTPTASDPAYQPYLGGGESSAPGVPSTATPGGITSPEMTSGTPGQNLIPLGNGTYFDLGTGKIISGTGDYGSGVTGGSPHGSFSY